MIIYYCEHRLETHSGMTKKNTDDNLNVVAARNPGSTPWPREAENIIR